MADFEYICQNGHALGSPHPLGRCAAFWDGAPCLGDLTRVQQKVVKRRRHLCEFCLDKFKSRHNLPDTEITQAQGGVCDTCQDAPVRFSVPNLQGASR